MARTIQESDVKTDDNGEKLTFKADGSNRIDLPSTDFVADAQMTREGNDLILETPDGQVAVIEGYFSAMPAPVLHAPDGSVLTPNLVDAFARSPLEFAANDTAADESPVGAVEEVKGQATVTRADGTVETITNGTPIYQGDVVQTAADGAVNIVFLDETSMAVSENARLAIDQYTYDPATESGTTNFSVLRGLFVFTSGLIGRDDPDDVKIDTPVGSIGIRGTIIAGEINPGGESNISVLEGAIVITNGAGNITLSEQFETVRLLGFEQPMQDMGTLPAADVGARFNSIGNVNPSLFTMINDAVGEQSNTNTPAPEAPKVDAAPEPTSSNDQSPSDSTSSYDVFSSIDGSVAKLDSTSSTGSLSNTTVTGTTTTTTTTATTSALQPVPTNTSTTITTTTDRTQSSTADLPPPPNVLNGTGTTSATRPIWADINLDNNAASASHRLISDLAYNGFGFSISALGDVNNDGFDDFVVGNNTTTAGQNHSYVFYGSATGINNTSPIGTTVANGTSTDDFSNSVVAGIGDFNGDGKRDYAVGQAYNGSGDQGQISIKNYNTGTSNFDQFPVINSPIASSEFGYSVSGAGDFNNDGRADIVVGIPGYNDGEAKIIFGAVSAPTSTLLASGGATGDYLGSDVSGIGDFNGDGYSDVIVGASGTDKAQIFFGYKNGGTAPTPLTLTGEGGSQFGTEVMGLGDINGDGYSDVLVGTEGNTAGIYFGGATPNADRDIHIAMPASHNITGGGTAGDFNGDGYKDFVITLGNANGTEGYIVLGKPSIANVIDYNYLQDANNAIRFKYSGADGTVDLEVTTLGDVNGDGYDDIGIGVPDANGAMTGDGGMFVVYGRPTGPSSTSIVGNATNNMLSDNNLSGMSLRGGAGDDIFQLNNTNFLGIDGGGGIHDAMWAMNNLDFSNVNYEKISGVEVLQYGSTGQTMTLTLENLFNLMKTSDSGVFKFDSLVAGNTLNIANTGATASSATTAQIELALNEMGDGATYNGDTAGYKEFSIGGYKLLVDIDLTVNISS